MNETKKMKFSIQPNTGCLSEEDAKRYFSVLGFSVFALMLSFYLSSIGLSYLLYWLAPALLSDALATQILSMIPLYGIAFPLFFVMIRRLPRGVPSERPLGAGGLVGGFCVCIAMMTVGNTVGQFFISFFEGVTGAAQENPVAIATDGNPWWINLIFVAVLPCILEELFFRKILCDRLLPLGEGYAVVISAVAFGLVHGNFFQFFYAFLVGLIFSVVYVKTGRVWIVVIYHGLINLLGGVLAPLLLQKLSPLMEESFLAEMEGYMAAGDSEGLSALLSPFMLPMVGILVYEGLMLAAVVAGFVYFFRKRKKVRFEAGLLPVPRSCRFSAVLLNVGTAAALTVFAAVFLLSLY